MDSLEKQLLILENKRKLTLDSVNNVENFNDNYVELATKLGVVAVEGNDLKIEALDQQTGKIYIVGEISGVFYSNATPRKSFWNKLFK